MPKTPLIGFFILILAAGNFFLAPALENAAQRARAEYTAGRTDETMQSRNENAFAQILGEVRATAADLMFVKTERYLHQGVGYRPHLRVDSVDQSKHFASCETGGVPTTIRNPGEDFRGFLGELERQVKPYLDPAKPHAHGSAEEMLPWFRLMTLSNPHYVRGYRIGAYALTRENKWEQALNFLQEGIERNQNNPELFLLYQSLAMLHLNGRTNKNYPWGSAWLEQSLEAARQAYTLGLTQRPPLGEAGKRVDKLTWSDDIEEDFLFAAHNLVMLLDEQGRLEEALRTAREIAELAPSYGPIRRALARLEEKAAAR